MGRNIYAELMPNRTRFESVRRKDISDILTTKSCCFDEVEDYFVADKSETKTMITQTHHIGAFLQKRCSILVQSIDNPE
jgi:hypothetical protein